MAQPQPVATFPDVAGDNLNGVGYALPGEFEGDVNLVFLAFYQRQQLEVDSWLPYAVALEQRNDGVRVYELPTLSRFNRLFKSFIDGGMRSGIPDPEARARTITLYLDREAFLRSLGLTGDQTIYALLVTRSGEVLWLERGPYSDTKARALEAALDRAREDA